MKRIISSVLVLCFVFALSCTAFAAGESYFDASVTVVKNSDGSVEVTVNDSPVLSAKKPRLTVDYAKNDASVLHGGIVAAAAVSNGKASFQVSEGGVYILAPGEYSAAVTTKPGCTTEGKYIYTSGTKTYTESIKAAGHDFGSNLPYCRNGCGTANPSYIPPAAGVPEQPVNRFADVSEGAYYYDAVIWAANEGVTSGTSSTTFDPNAECSRGEMAVFLWRAAGSPDAAGFDNPFTDVAENASCYKAVLWAAWKGVIKGTGKDTFGPGETCTRGQVIACLYRMAGSPAVSGRNPFTDVSENDYCYNAVLWAAQNNITAGTGGSVFSPDSPCIRSQVVAFIYNYQKK